MMDEALVQAIRQDAFADGVAHEQARIVELLRSCGCDVTWNRNKDDWDRAEALAPGACICSITPEAIAYRIENLEEN